MGHRNKKMQEFTEGILGNGNEKKRKKESKEQTAFRLGQMVSIAGDTTSFELRPTGTGENKKVIISNKEYKRRMGL